MASPDAASPGTDSVAAAPSQPSPSSSVGLSWTIGPWTLVLALLAGAAAWLVGESTFDYFKPSLAASENVRGFNPFLLNQEMPGVRARNGAATFGALGGLLGLALGLAGGLSRRSAVGVLLGALVGLILGTAAGALPALAVMPWQFRHRHDDPSTSSLFMPLLIHLGLWSTVGLAAGLAFGVGAGASPPSRIIRAALAGLVGAMMGTVVFEVVGAVLFPMAHTPDPFSATSGTRLMARLCVAGFVGLGVICSLLPAGPRTIRTKRRSDRVASSLGGSGA
jgi:hypothetical protein